MTRPAEPELARGVRVAGRYRVEAPIARGGMGAVYAVVDEPTGARLALKRRHGGRPRDARMFEREYHTLRSLEHPRIIQVHDYGVDADGAYYTMELLDGEDLRGLAPLPYRRACAYLRDVASCLALLHARQLLHRDLSAGNVRVTGEDRCKLIDFGVLTSFGIAEVVAGTPPMVPPEALSGAPLDQRADLFSLGALAFWMLTGRHAFPARSLDELAKLWRSRPQPPSKLREALGLAPQDDPIPDALDSLVLALLSQNPVARPASAAEVIDRLNAIADLEPEAEPLAAESYLSSARMVGRDRQKERLLARLDTAIEGTGASVVIEADPGLGSSRLIAEVAVAALLRGGMPLVVDAKLRRGTYGVVQDVIAKLLEAAPELALSAARPHADALAHVAPELGGRRSDAPASGSRLAQGELRVRVQVALGQWLCAVAAERPLLLAIDDAQHLDEASAALFATLAHHARDHRMLLVLVLKTDEAPTAAAAPVVGSLEESSAAMSLGRLDKAQVHELLQGVFGPVPHLSRLAEQAFRTTAGNPLACVEMVRHLVRCGAIRHAEGVWTLPRELDADQLPNLARPHARRIGRLSEPAGRLAQALSVHVGPLPLELCLAIGDGEAPGDVWVALEELTREGVLGRSATGYHFVHDGLRAELSRGLDASRRRQVHRQMGEQFALRSEGDVDAMLDAGFHLLQGGDEGRGADLLAAAGILLGYDSDEMAAAVPPLRAALAVFREQRRPPHELVKLLGPLCNAAWYCDRRLADECGDEAVEMLADQIGLSLAARLRPWVGKRLSLYLGLGQAALAYTFGRGRGGIRALREHIVMYFNCVLSLCGVAATCLDAERAEAYVGKLEHLTALGRDHAASISHRMAELLALAPRERMAEAMAGCRAVIDRLESGRPVRDLPPDSRLMILGGLHYELGAFESFRDGPGALREADALEGVGLQLYRMVADQVRANYHACRGEIAIADRYRDRVEMHAVQAGSAWQAEVWAPASAIVACMVTEDLIGMKRAHEELTRLSAEVPSLGRHAEVARGAVLWMRGESDAALAAWQPVVEGAAPRSFIGWGAVHAAVARAHNELGEHARARSLCQDTLTQLGHEDLTLTAMYLPLSTELAIAEAGLGQPQAAMERMRALLDDHRERGGPTTLGLLHKTCARIALQMRDVVLALEHLGHMERSVKPTRNPALLQQCAALRTRIAALQHAASEPPDLLIATDAGEAGGDDPTVTLTERRSISALDTCESRKRLDRALSLIVAEAGGSSGLLLAITRGELAVLSPTGETAPAEHILDQVRRDVRDFERARRGISAHLAPGPLDVGTLLEPSRVRPRAHHYRTVVLSMDGEHAVGAVALLAGEEPQAVDDALVRAVTASLLRAGDLSDTSTASSVGNGHCSRT